MQMITEQILVHHSNQKREKIAKTKVQQQWWGNMTQLVRKNRKEGEISDDKRSGAAQCLVHCAAII